MIKKQVSAISYQHSAFSLRVIFLFLLYALCSMLYARAFADDEVVRIQEAYKNIEDIKGSFVQKSYIKDLKRTDTYKGALFIKRPSKMKCVYKGEKPQEIIINNERIIIYNKSENRHSGDL